VLREIDFLFKHLARLIRLCHLCGDLSQYFQSQKNAIQSIYQCLVIQFNNAKYGEKAPNPSLHDLESKVEKTLLSMSKKNRPLVINFGSCS